jgi:uncharacterized protein DUF1684
VFAHPLPAAQPRRTGADSRRSVIALCLDVFEFGFAFGLEALPIVQVRPERWSCPLPPKENRLAVRIEVGEKKYHESE